MNETKIIISADGKKAIQVTDEVTAAYKKLGAQSIAEINRQKAEVSHAYGLIKNSGIASAEEIKQAYAAKTRKIAELDKEMLSGQHSIFEKIKANWMAIAGTMGTIIGLGITIKSIYDQTIQSVANHGEEFYKMSQQTGISVENISGLTYAAEQAESSIEALVTGSKFFAKALTGMNEEGENTTQIFKAIGVTSRDPYTAILQTAEALSKMEDGAGKTTLTVKLFGRGAMELIPLLNQGSTGLKDLQGEAARLGIVFSDKAARAADEFNDNINRLKSSLSGLVKSIGNSVIPILNDLMEYMAGGENRTKLLSRYTELDTEIKSMESVRAWFKAHGLGFLVAEDNKILDARIKERDDLIKKLKGPLGSETQEKGKQNKPPVIPDKEAAARALEIQNKAVSNFYDNIMKEGEAAQEAIKKRDEERFKRETEYARFRFEMEDIFLEKGIVTEEELTAVFNQEVENRRKLLEIEKNDRIQAYNDSWQAMMNMANQVGGDMGAAMGSIGAGMKGISDVYAGEDPYSKELARRIEHYQQMEAATRDHKDREAIMNQEFEGLKIAQEEAAQKQKLSIASNSFGAMAGMSRMFYEASGKQSKTAFAAYKVLSIAQTTIDTYQAAVAAYKAMVGIPFVGPALAAAAAATAIGFGMAKIAQIKSMSATGVGGGGSAVPSAGGGYSYTQPTAPSWQKEGKETMRPLQVTLNIYGSVVDHDKFAREVVPSIQKAVQDGVR